MKNGLSWAAEHPTSNGQLNPTRIGVVQNIRLNYVYVQEKENPDNFLMVPAWLFSYQTQTGMETSLPYQVAINAVDGSRIELNGR